MPHKPCRGSNVVRPQVRQPKRRYYAAALEISQIDERCSYTHGTMFSGCVSTTCLHVVFILWFNTVMDDLISAVTHLRSALGDSQQAFANRLGLSFRSVANYEKDRRPAGRVLYQLANLAHEHGQENLAGVFAAAFSKEVNADVEPTTHEERVWTRALLLILRRRADLSSWQALSDGIIASLSELAEKSEDRERQDVETLLVHTRLHVERSALRLLDILAEERHHKTGEPKERALLEILQQHPDLYARYNQERAEAMKGIGAAEVHLDQRHSARAPRAKRSKK